ncbi:hypothetical protein KUTeg_007373 [Tegillarca granosa]|uniref:G-protein coupled receptors family 1 profile domain-containing protein n=1 Tax=Tegillarca granosa TaxID=220873 RepID=A0ABQ9FHP4_TEGGR|nr:hypothetical protein KUTeg_007373 [Tegillarca granosa]
MKESNPDIHFDCSPYNCSSEKEIYFNKNMNYTDEDITEMIMMALGSKRKDMFSVVVLITVYVIIFSTGVVGNISTCFVIVKNSYMHTVVNYYLFSLAISDLLILLLVLPVINK